MSERFVVLNRLELGLSAAGSAYQRELAHDRLFDRLMGHGRGLAACEAPGDRAAKAGMPKRMKRRSATGTFPSDRCLRSTSCPKPTDEPDVAPDSP